MAKVNRCLSKSTSFDARNYPTETYIEDPYFKKLTTAIRSTWISDAPSKRHKSATMNRLTTGDCCTHKKKLSATEWHCRVFIAVIDGRGEISDRALLNCKIDAVNYRGPKLKYRWYFLKRSWADMNWNIDGVSLPGIMWIWVLMIR